MNASVSFSAYIPAGELATYGAKAGDFAYTPMGLAVFAIATGNLTADTETHVLGSTGHTGATGISAVPDIAVPATAGIWLHVLGKTAAGDYIVPAVVSES